MRWLRVARHRLRSLFRSGRADDDLDRELELHFELLVREQMAGGLGEPEERRAARRAFGSPHAARDRCRDTRRVALIEDLVKDVRYALRTLRRSPGFALTAIVSLALGIGANIAVFSLVDTVLLRPLPVERSHELAFLKITDRDALDYGAPPYPCFRRMRDQVPAFSGLAAFASDEMRVEVDGALEQVFGQAASGNYFELLGVRPVAGRLFTPDDERLDRPVAVISEAYWHRRFGGDPAAIGRAIRSGARTLTIVGVTPAGFHGLDPGRRVDVTVPIANAGRVIDDPGAWWFEAVARVRPDASLAEATAQADTVFQQFMRDRPASGGGRQPRLQRTTLTPAARGLDGLRRRFATPLHVMTAIGAMLLLVACLNLGSLLITRGESRARELAIRMATGAGPGRLVRQLLTETFCLFVAGAVAGVAASHALLQGVVAFFAAGRRPLHLDVQYDWRLAAFAVTVALTAGLLTGLWPALRALTTEPHAAMKDGEGRVAGSRRATLSGRVLVAGQMALSLVLLAAAAFFVDTMMNLREVSLGFRGARVLTMSLDLVMPQDAADDARPSLHRAILDRVRALAGVDAASLSVLTPLSGRDTGEAIAVPGFEPRAESDRIVRTNQVSEDYFRTFGVALIAGRVFTPADTSRSFPVAVLNQAAAAAYFPGRSPIGGTIVLGDSPPYTVVGVVADYRHKSVREPAPRFVFVPIWQPYYPVRRATLAVSSDRPEADLTRAVTAAVHASHQRTLVSDVIAVERQIDETLIGERLLSRLGSGFAALAVVLALVGLYGVLGFTVARRRTEFAVRIALGARPSQVACGVLHEIVPPVAAGLALGLPAAMAVSRSAEALLFGVTPRDAAPYAISIAVLVATAALAAWIPARRAASIDPAEALRQ